MRADAMEPATYTVGELRDLAEKIYVASVNDPNDSRGHGEMARWAISGAAAFAEIWGEHVKVKP